MGRKTKRKSKSSHSQRSSSTKQIPKHQSLAIEDSEPTDKKLIPITDRLDLPPYRPDDPEDEEPELQLDFRPRLYFAASLCLVCSRRCEIEYPCTVCAMVVYCSERHRQQNCKQHGQLCAVLEEICRRNGGLALAKGLGPDEYRSFRLELLRIVAGALGRRMELWEQEIILYPRLCRSCHAPEGLEACHRCAMEFFCADEEGRGHRGDHERHCLEFRVFGRILASQREDGFASPRVPDFCVGEDREMPRDMDSLIREIYAFGCGYEKIDCASYAALSQAASPALTALCVARSLQLAGRDTNRKALKIDVIGAELQFECVNVSLWEKLFLHLVPDVKSLKLEFCGPELQVPDDIADVLRRPPLCTSCRARSRTLDIVFHCGKLYHQVDSDRPDLVCLFNPGLYRTTGFANQDTWPETIAKFCEHGVPVLITSYTEIELPLDLARVRASREIELVLEPRRNPFASLKPERNFVSDDVAPLIYKNYFLGVAKGIAGRAER